MKLVRRQFLRLMAGGAALPTLPQTAAALAQRMVNSAVGQLAPMLESG